MEYRPLIGVPTQTLQVVDGIPENLPVSWVMNQHYCTALVQAGAAPVLVPLIDDVAALRTIYETLNGVFLAGGVDIDPSVYGQPRDASCGRTDADRDRVEILLAQWARADDKPLFGVCRGMQLINVAAGGSLVQHYEQLEGAIKHDYFPSQGFPRDHLAHTVQLEEGTRLHDLFGSAEITVNSMHHQGVQQLAAGLRSSAHAPDGLVEAIEAPGDTFTVGVQWHPEVLASADQKARRLFHAFVDAAADYAARRSSIGMV